MDEAVLKSFLVELGFKSDPSKLKAFLAQVDAATKKIGGLGAGMIQAGKTSEKAIGGIATDINKMHEAAKRPEFAEGLEKWTSAMAEFTTAIAGLAYTVVKTIDSLDRMFFASQRAGSAAKNMEPWRVAATEVGIGAGIIDDSMAGMRMQMLQMPAVFDGFARSFGVATTDAQGQARDMAEIWGDLIPALKAKADQMGPMGFRIISEQAKSFFGIDPGTLRLLFDNWDELQAKRDAYKPPKLGDDASSRAGHELDTQLRSLAEAFDKLKQAAVTDFAPAFGEVLTMFRSALDLVTQLGEKTGGLSTALLGFAGLWYGTKAAGAVLRSILGALGIGGAAAAGGEAAAGAEAGGLLAGMSLGPVGIAIVAAVAAYMLNRKLSQVAPGDPDYQKWREGQDKQNSQFYKTNPGGLLGLFQDFIDRWGQYLSQQPGSGWDPAGKPNPFPDTPYPPDYMPTYDQRQDQGARPMSRYRNAAPGGDGRRAALPAAPLGLVDAVIQAESGGNPNVRDSPKGAHGLMQIEPDTGLQIGRELGETYHPENDPGGEQNKRFGIYYLQQQLARFGGSIIDALVAYNAGPGFAAGWVQRGEDFTKLPLETQAYVKGILSSMGETSMLSSGPPLLGNNGSNVSNNVNMSQRTTIHVAGGGQDPLVDARAIANVQGRVNGDLCRNLRGCSQDWH